MNKDLTQEYLDYLKLLSKSYPSIKSAATEVINLRAILNLPKGTEHFLSDIHGAYLPFKHLLNSASGVIMEKINDNFKELTSEQKISLATIIYYPKEKLEDMKKRGVISNVFYHYVISYLVEMIKICGSKYTRSKVRKSMNSEFSYIIEELIQSHEYTLNKEEYYKEIINAIIETNRAKDLVIEMAELIQRLSLDHLHILGDLYDRGHRGYATMEHVVSLPSVDITWGNHDIAYMGAAAGNKACIANVIRTCCRYNNLSTLEDGYGLSLRPLVMFAMETYKDDPCTNFMPDTTENTKDDDKILVAKMHKAITVIMLKLESQLIDKHPNYGLEHLRKIDRINYDNYTIDIKGKTYELLDTNLPTVDPKNPTKLTVEEENVINKLVTTFKHCDKFQRHIDFFFSHGAMYLTYNSNLLFHGCIPTDENGEFTTFETDNHHFYKGKEFLDYCDRKVRKGYYGKRDDKGKEEAVDFFWYLWCGKSSPLFGKNEITTFERYFLDKTNKELVHESMNPYFKYHENEEYCIKVLKEFGLDSNKSVIINGHVPVKIIKGEKPVKANGKLIIIDGGICKAYQAQTGMAGYTLIYNSWGMRLVAHQPFTTLDEAVKMNKDVIHSVEMLTPVQDRIMVKDTDQGKRINKRVDELLDLLKCYEEGIIQAK